MSDRAEWAALPDRRMAEPGAAETQSAVARFEAGGTVPTLPVLERLAHALDVTLDVRFAPKTAAA